MVTDTQHDGVKPPSLKKTKTQPNPRFKKYRKTKPMIAQLLNTLFTIFFQSRAYKKSCIFFKLYTVILVSFHHYFYCKQQILGDSRITTYD